MFRRKLFFLKKVKNISLTHLIKLRGYANSSESFAYIQYKLANQFSMILSSVHELNKMYLIRFLMKIALFIGFTGANAILFFKPFCPSLWATSKCFSLVMK